MNVNSLILFVVVCFPLFITGCVYSGPVSAPDEVKNVRKDVVRDFIVDRATKLKKVNDVGYRIVKNLPAKFGVKDASGYIGVVLMDLNENTRQAYQLPDEIVNGAVVVGNVAKSKAEFLDVKHGDVLIGAGDYRVKNRNDALRIFRNYKPERFITLHFYGKDGRYQRHAYVEYMPISIYIGIEESGDINAYATPNSVIITTAMLRFVENEDELATVIGHEVAHIVLSHHMQSMGVSLAGDLFRNVVGSMVGAKFGSIGQLGIDLAAGAAEGGFSRELERAADYWGVYFALRGGYDVKKGKEIWRRFALELPQSQYRTFLSSHPTSLERLANLEKVVKEFEEGKFPDVSEK